MQVSEAVSLYAIVNSWRRSSDLQTTHHEDVRLDFSAVSDSHQLEAASDVLKILPDITHVAVWSETQSAHHLNTRNDSVFTESQPRTTISTDYSAFTFYQNYKSSQINWLLIKVFMCIRGVLCYSYMYFTRGSGCEVSWWVMTVGVSVCPRGYLRNHTRDLYFLWMLPMSVARCISGTLTIGRIACRRERGDGSAQRGRSVIYDYLVLVCKSPIPLR